MLELLVKQQDDWIRIAYNMTDDMDEAKDLVQEMYLEVIEGTRNIKDITYKDEINRYFVWKLLKSLFVDRMRDKQGRSVNKQSVSYWVDMSNELPEQFKRMVNKERKMTRLKGEPVTFLRDQSKSKGALFLAPNEDYPHIRDISMVRVRVDKKRIETYPIIEDVDDLACEVYDYEEEDAFGFILDKIKRITSSWKVYDRQLFDLYFIEGQSLRQISSGAGIGLNSIHNSVKSYRQILRDELSDDLTYYFENYDKI